MILQVKLGYIIRNIMKIAKLLLHLINKKSQLFCVASRASFPMLAADRDLLSGRQKETQDLASLGLGG